MLLPGREWQEGYRFGFNGYENTSGIFENQIVIDFGARVYDCRLAKFFSIDPRSIEYPWQSAYAYFANSPVFLVDVDGMGEGDPPKGYSKWEGANGTDLIVPDGTKLLGVFTDEDKNGRVNYGDKNLEASLGEVRHFQVDGVGYLANFNDDGSFNGYWDAHGNEYQYEAENLDKVNLASNVLFETSSLINKGIKSNTSIRIAKNYSLAKTTVRLPVGTTRVSTEALSAMSKSTYVLTKSAPVINLCFVGYDIVTSRSVTVGNVYDVGITIASIWAPPVGLGALIGDGISYASTGHNISSNIDGALNGGVLFNW